MLEAFPREGQYFCGFLPVIIREPSLFVAFVVGNSSWKRLKGVLDAGGGRLNHNITQENWIVRHAVRFPAKITVKMAVFDENVGRVAFFWREEKEMALGDRWRAKEISYFVNFEEKTGRGGWNSTRRKCNKCYDAARWSVWFQDRGDTCYLSSSCWDKFFVDIINILDVGNGIFGVLIVLHVWYNFFW